jgi:hypothetical protein
MKTLKFFAGLLCAVLLCTSCNENTPDISKGNEQIKGIWRIEKGTRTYCPGAGQTVEQLDIPSRLPIPQEWYFGAFQGNEMVKYNPYSISQDFRWRDYSLTIVDNCYKLKIDGWFDTEGYNPNEPERLMNASPIKVTKLNNSSMVWEFMKGGGDEGADTYRLEMKKVATKP